jgi:deoxyribonuclease-4
VHAPYVLNVATTNNRIRIPSRKFLQQYQHAAAEVGAAGLIVHGGHVPRTTTRPSALTTGAKCIDRLEMPVRC